MRIMTKALFWPLGLLASMASVTTLAQQPTPELQALDDALPGVLINDPTRLDWATYGTTLSAKPIKDDAIPGGKAAGQYTIAHAGAAIFDAGTNAPITAAIKSGSDIVVAFYARALSAETPDGKGRIGLRVQQNEAPYSGFGDTVLTISKEWKLYEVVMKANANIPRGKAVVGFQLAGAKQVVEIGQTIVLSGTTTLAGKAMQAKQTATTDLLPQLQGKGKLISNPANKDWASFGAGGIKAVVPSPNIPGTGGTAMQVKTSAAGKNPYDVGAAIPLTEAVAEGDSLLIAVLARTTPGSSADGVGKLGVRIQLNEAPYPGFGDGVMQLAPTWRLLQFKVKSNLAIPAGKAALVLHFAHAAQSIEVGQVYVLKADQPAGQPKP